jgi:hypothetical protein
MAKIGHPLPPSLVQTLGELEVVNVTRPLPNKLTVIRNLSKTDVLLHKSKTEK